MEKTGSKLTDLTDLELVHLAMEQNQAAFIVLYTRHLPGELPEGVQPDRKLQSGIQVLHLAIQDRPQHGIRLPQQAAS